MQSDALEKVETIGSWDADLAKALGELGSFLAVMERDPQVQFVCGSRVLKLGSAIKGNAARHYLGRVFATAASVLLPLPVYDTQCGAKPIRSALAKDACARPFASRWVFDVELFARVIAILGRDKAMLGICEVSLDAWKEKGASRVGVRSGLRAPWQVLQIWHRYRSGL
jgi:hypothetical protein